MAGLKCFTALHAFLLLSLLVACLTSLPASAVEQLGGVVGEGDSAFDSQLTTGEVADSLHSPFGFFRRLLDEKKKKKKKDDGKDDDKKKKDKKDKRDKKDKKDKKKKDSSDNYDKVIKKKKTKTVKDDGDKNSKGKYKYQKKSTSDKKKKDKGDDYKKKPLIKKKRSPPPPEKKTPKVPKYPKVPKFPKSPKPSSKPPVPYTKPPTSKPGSTRGPASYGGGGGNPIDNCALRSDWRTDRKRLAGCAIGFGSNAIGGRDGEIYVVTDSGDHPTAPWPGTLRWGLVQLQPLWITFAHDMDIVLKNELIFTSYKTVDGRGAKVTVGLGGPCFTLQNVQHVIIENIKLVGCSPGHSGDVISSTAHTGHRNGADGDAISVFNGQHIWVDHCTLARAADGLIDCIHGSDAITISNNYFSDHDKVMLFGHSDSYVQDKSMRITVAYNTFGPNLVQRMPRCRHGQFHVINNDYAYGWGIYAIGGSGDPTILSEGNRFNAVGASKQVTKRETGGSTGWSWHSRNDVLLNGAYFVDSGGYDYSVVTSTAAGVAQFWSEGLTKRSGCLSL